MIHLPDVPAVLRWLLEKPAYAGILKPLADVPLHRGQMEPLLRESIFRDFTKLYRFADPKQKKFLHLYFVRYEVFFLKLCLTNLIDRSDKALDTSNLQTYFEKYSKLPMEKLSSVQTISEFLRLLADSGYEKAFIGLAEKKDATLFDYELLLDQYGFSTMWKRADELSSDLEKQEIKKILGSKFDMLNLLWIYRAKTYYQMDKADIYAMILPIHSRVKKEEIRALVESSSAQDLQQKLQRTWYGRQFPDFSTKSMEAGYTRILKALLKRESLLHPYSATIMYRYLYRKEHEVDRLVIALEAVRYHISPSAAAGYLAIR